MTSASMGKRIYSTQEDIVKIIEDKGIKAILVSPLKHKSLSTTANCKTRSSVPA